MAVPIVTALPAEEVVLWQVSLTVGAVVIIVVIALLGLLLSFVRNIEAGAKGLLAVGGGVAKNTNNISTALTVADTLDAITDEAVRHAGLLGVKL
jgi:hypothetical protein